jgi:hypothetical protein
VEQSIALQLYTSSKLDKNLTSVLSIFISIRKNQIWTVGRDELFQGSNCLGITDPFEDTFKIVSSQNGCTFLQSFGFNRTQ